MGFTIFEKVLVAVGIPFNLWYFFGSAAVNPRLLNAMLLVWIGFGLGLVVLSRNSRRTRR